MAQGQRSLRAAEVGGQRLSGRLRDHTRSGEAKKRARFCDADVGETGETRQYATRTGVDQHGDVRTPGLIQEVDCTGGLRHLHQTENALLHACAARATDGHQWQTVPRRHAGPAPEALTNYAAHASAHEPKVHDSEHAAHTFYARRSRNKSLRKASLRLRGTQALRIRLDIDEVQWIERRHRRPLLAKGALIRELSDAIAHADPQVQSTVRTHHEVGAQSSRTGAFVT